MIHKLATNAINHASATASRCAALGLVTLGLISSGNLVSAQELISPGTQIREASELPAPTLSGESDSLTNDRLDEYRRALEDHLLKKERAKLEARARFESRSLDLVPPPLPPRRLTPQRPTTLPSSESPEIQGLPQPEIESDSRSSWSAPATSANEDALLSPSDRPQTRDRSLDDLLAPPVPAKEAKPKSVRDLPAPLRSELAPQTPQRLGQNSDKSNARESNPFPKSSSSNSGSQDGQREIPKFQVVPESERQAKPAPPQSAPTRADPPQTLDRDEPDSGAGDRSTVRSNPSQHSVLQPPSPYEDDEWSRMVDSERYRWGTPVSFRGSMPISNVHCSTCGGCVDRRGKGCVDRVGVVIGVGTRERPKCQCWRCPQQAPFNTYGVGGYVGPARNAPVAEYRLRSGDQIQLTFLIKTVRTAGAYRLVVGDQLLVESDADANLTRGTLERGLEIQPDGTITLRFIGQVHAAGQTIEQLRAVLNERYEEFYPDPSIDVTPVQTNNVARQIREAISGSEGFNPQQALQTVTPEGSIRLPRLGAVPTQGLTLGELKREINLRYDSLGAGLEVEVVLEQQAPHFVYVLGEVNQPGQFEMLTPTTVLGGLSLAGSYVPGANLRQVVIFRRGANWELISTILDLRGAILGKASRPADEIWLQDGDVIIVPPTPIRVFDRFVQQVFTEGIYGIAPFLGNVDVFNQNNN